MLMVTGSERGKVIPETSAAAVSSVLLPASVLSGCCTADDAVSVWVSVVLPEQPVSVPIKTNASVAARILVYLFLIWNPPCFPKENVSLCEQGIFLLFILTTDIGTLCPILHFGEPE